MHGLQEIQKANIEAVIVSIIARADKQGLKLSRTEVLDELAWNEDEDVSAWGATVDRLLGVQS